MLSTHLNQVAELASLFTGEFGAGDWGRASDLLHDIGKLAPEFQALLHGSKAKVDHSAVECFGIWGQLLAYAIAGHHAGLANWSGEITSGDLSPLEKLRRRLATSGTAVDRHLLLPARTAP